MNSEEIEKFKKGIKLTSEQREVLIGVLLGDAHLETQNRGRTFRLKIEQSAKHKTYVKHLYGVFKPLVLKPPQQKRRGSWWFQTVSHGCFRFYSHQFYQEGRKCVPRLIHRWLTPHSLTYWFMDDGSIKSKESKGVIFNTQCFPQKEVKLLISALKSCFKLQAKLRKQAEGYQIYISGNSYECFRELVEPFLIEEMMYKLPKARRT